MRNAENAVKPEFLKQLQSVYDSYILMKNAFVATDANLVSENAAKVKSGLQDVNMALLEGETHMQWMKYLKTLETEIDGYFQRTGYFKPENRLRSIQ